MESSSKAGKKESNASGRRLLLDFLYATPPQRKHRVMGAHPPGFKDPMKVRKRRSQGAQWYMTGITSSE